MLNAIKKSVVIILRKKENNYVDCVYCEYGTSTGNGYPCSECYGNYFIRKENEHDGE